MNAVKRNAISCISAIFVVNEWHYGANFFGHKPP